MPFSWSVATKNIHCTEVSEASHFIGKGVYFRSLRGTRIYIAKWSNHWKPIECQVRKVGPQEESANGVDR